METESRERLKGAVELLRARGVGSARAALSLDAGFGSVLLREGAVRIPYREIPGFPERPFPDPEGALDVVSSEGFPVLALRGRGHYYEGLALRDLAHPVRVAHALGAAWIALVDTVVGLDPTLRVGDLVVIQDHLNLMGDNPLIGPNDDEIGPRFPDLSGVWDERLRGKAEAAAAEQGTVLRRGILAGVTGPGPGTEAERAMLRKLGGDVAGTSCVPEAIAAGHAGMKALGIAVVGRAGEAPPESVRRVEGILQGLLQGEDL